MLAVIERMLRVEPDEHNKLVLRFWPKRHRFLSEGLRFNEPALLLQKKDRRTATTSGADRDEIS